jgi:hypothetical protein
MTTLPYVTRPGRAAAIGKPSAGTQGAFYRPLFSVQFQHDFYNSNNGLCPDFKIMPDAASAALMEQLGMLFRDQKIGFAVFINERNILSLLNYIERSEKEDENAWCWLNFIMVQTNNLFVGITALPIDTVPTGQAMWFCNTQAHDEAGEALLTPGPAVDTDALHQVTGAQIVMDVPLHTKPVLLDISGNVVLRIPPKHKPEPVFIPKHYARAHKMLMTADFAAAPAPVPPTERYRFDISTLPHDLYTVALDPHTTKHPVQMDYPRDYVYLPPNRQAFGVIDLLFVQPHNVASGIYPVSRDIIDQYVTDHTIPDPAMIGNVSYVLQFNARETVWQYYIVCQGKDDTLAHGLEIKGGGMNFDQSNARLPTGAPAVLFTATTPLKLQQSSTVELRLTGARQGQDGHRNPIRIARLPVAPSAPVWPATNQDELRGTSEMYVYV